MIALLSLLAVAAAPSTPLCMLEGGGPLPSGLVFARGAIRPFAHTADFVYAHELRLQLPPIIAQRAQSLVTTDRVKLELEIQPEFALKGRARAKIKASLLEVSRGGAVELRYSTTKGALVRLLEPELFHPARPLEVEVPCGALELGLGFPQAEVSQPAAVKALQVRGDEVSISEKPGGPAVGVIVDEPYADLLATEGTQARIRIESDQGTLEGWVALSETSAVEGNFGSGSGALEGKIDHDLAAPEADQLTCKGLVPLSAQLDAQRWTIGQLLPGHAFSVVRTTGKDTFITVTLDGLTLLPGVELLLDATAWKTCRSP